jgi:hypothetical protein
MKINWSKAPEWANYIAQDYDGSWAWFESRPRPCKMWEYWVETEGRVLAITPENPDWQDTLQERPKTK